MAKPNFTRRFSESKDFTDNQNIGFHLNIFLSSRNNFKENIEIKWNNNEEVYQTQEVGNYLLKYALPVGLTVCLKLSSYCNR